MSMDRSLKLHGGLIRSRSVLSRAERIKMLTDEGKFDPAANSPFGLPKVKVRHSKAGTKTKKEEAPAEGEAAVAEGAAPAAPAAGAKAPQAGKPVAGKPAAGKEEKKK